MDPFVTDSDHDGIPDGWEILYGLNQADKFILAVVIVDGDAHEGPHYIHNPFTQEPDWAVTSVNLELGQLMERAVSAKASL